jgi:hypothetical protein
VKLDFMFPARDYKPDHLQRKRRGFYLAEVTANTDEGSDSRYRVKVKYPWLQEGEDTSYWARILTPMAGGERGVYFLPEVGDQVLVVFEHGDIGRPIVVGGLWSKAQKPPEKNSSGKNNIREIKSRSGHRLIFDDTSGSERVILVHSGGENKIALDTGQSTVTMECASGDIEIKASSGAGRFFGDVVKITAKNNFTAQGATLEANAAAKIQTKASSMLSLKAGNVAINAGGGGAAGGGGSSASASGSQGSEARDQVRESGEGGGGGGAAGGGGGGGSGSPAQREQSTENLPESDAEPAAAAGAEAGAAEIEPGQPVEVSAAAANVEGARCELVDADTGEVLATSPARSENGKVTGKVETTAIAGKPEIEAARVRVVSADGKVLTETRPIPVRGRGGPVGGPSPSSALADPKAPAASAAVVSPSLGPTPGPLEEAEMATTASAEAAASARTAREKAEKPRAAARAEVQSQASAESATAGAAARGDAAGVASAEGGASAGAAVRGDAAGVASAEGGAGAGAAVRGDAGGVASAEGGASAGAAARGDAAGVASAEGGASAGAAARGDAAGVASAEGAGSAGAAVRGDAGGAVRGGGGIDGDVIRAGEAAAEGDAAGATAAVGGSQAGAAVRGDAGGAAGGGSIGAAAEGDAAGVVSAEGGATAGAAARGDASGAVTAQSSTAGTAARVGGDPGGAGAAVTGEAATKAVGVRALDADSPEDVVEGAQRDAERHAMDESGAGAAKGSVDRSKSQAHSARTDAERATDVEARASAEASDAEYTATADARADVSSGQGEARRAQGDVASTAADPGKQVYDQRATVDGAEREASDVAGAPDREAAGARAGIERDSADARDPESAARRTQRDAIDQAKSESVVESRATLEESDLGESATGERDRVRDHRDSGKSTASDPDREVKRKLRDDLDD